MGFLRNLFGGGKRSDFTPSTELMPEERFWELIVVSHKKADGEMAMQIEELEVLLQKVPLQEVITFHNRYRQLRGLAYTWPLWGAAYLMNGGCSDDGFCYWRDWLIAQGPEVYKQALADPEWLVNVEWDDEEMEAEQMAYVPAMVFEERTGSEDFPAISEENFAISGTQWREESDDLQRMFPKLWAKYSKIHGSL